MKDDSRRADDKTRRNERLAEALRANLERRKALQRARAGEADVKTRGAASVHAKESG